MSEKIMDNIKLKGVNCILVDEVQFMTKEQIKELWTIAKLKNKPVKLMNVIQHELKEDLEKLNKLKKQFDERLSTSRK